MGVEEKLLKILVGPNRFFLFEKVFIPKKSKKSGREHREVWRTNKIVGDAYKVFNRRFGLFLKQAKPDFPHAAAYGYVRGKGIRDNAKIHCRKKYILHADIRNFFPSIDIARIESVLIDVGIKPPIATIISKFLTIEDLLPLGLSSSPLIANLVCLDLDIAFESLAKRYSATYTRYADDLTFSSDNELPKRSEIEELLNKHKFQLSAKKFRITKNGQAHYVTGLSVQDFYPHAPRILKRRLRQEIYFCKKFGIINHIENKLTTGYSSVRAEINRIDGMVRYISYFEPTFSTVRETWKHLLKKEKLTVGYGTNASGINFFSFYIDESIQAYRGKKYLIVALAIVDFEAMRDITDTTKVVLRRAIFDPYAGSRKKKLIKYGLHYTDSNEDLRTKFIDCLATFSFRGYVAYKEIEDTSNYSDAYISIVKSLLNDRLMDCDGAYVNIVFENNSQIKVPNLIEVTNGIYKTLCETQNPRPFRIDAIVGEKNQHAGLSVSDYLLGVFRGYATLRIQKMKMKKKLEFEKLRDRLKFVLDVDRKLIFTRKRPFLPWD